MNRYFHRDNPLYFVFPINGDCINENDGRVEGDTLFLPVIINAPEGKTITVNGVEATYVDGKYKAEVGVVGYRTTFVATDGESSDTIAVYRLPNVMKKYRLSSDDNILFLADLNAHKDEYTSIFDNPYLALYKKAHDLYGAKVHLNLFYAFDPKDGGFSSDREYFDLSMMTDRYKAEFQANADWLNLAFHAYKAMPYKPYQFATAEQITEDCVKVCKEIIRFAGEECLSDATTIHWGETSVPALRALRTLGFRNLAGYFEKYANGDPMVAYHTSGELTDHIGRRDFWYDTNEDIMFTRIDCVLNRFTLEKVQAVVQEAIDTPTKGGFISVMIHEQYFYEDYAHYLPDFEERVLSVCRNLHESGYTGSQICEATDEPHLAESFK